MSLCSPRDSQEGGIYNYILLYMYYEFEQTPGDSEGQGSLACCNPWGQEESDMTERLNNSMLYAMFIYTAALWLKSHPL